MYFNYLYFNYSTTLQCKGVQGKGEGGREGKGKGEGERRDRGKVREGKENGHRPPTIFGLKVALDDDDDDE